MKQRIGLATIAACDLKVGRCGQLIKLMNICEYLRSRLFLDLCPRSFAYENKNLFAKKKHSTIFNQILYVHVSF